MRCPIGQQPRHGQQGPGRGLVETGPGQASGLQRQGHRDRLLVVEQQRRQRLARREPVPALGPPGRVDRVAELAQTLDVATHGALADLEPSGQRRSRPRPVRLHQRQQGEEALGRRRGGCGGHDVIIAREPDRS
jgi:hypothetical protein